MSIEQAKNQVGVYISRLGLSGYVEEIDSARPWGGFWRFDNNLAHEFAALTMPDLDLTRPGLGANLSPKLLLVDAGQRLSLQRHRLRQEIWSALTPGNLLALVSEQPLNSQWRTMEVGKILEIPRRWAHRLRAVDYPGLVAELWEHTHPNGILSDEQDIERLEDDHRRA